MSGFWTVIQTMVISCTVLGLAFLILVASPPSRLRSFCIRVAKLFFAGCMLTLVVLPLDFIPDFVPLLGWVDDPAYLLAAILALVSVFSSQSEDGNDSPLPQPPKQLPPPEEWE